MNKVILLGRLVRDPEIKYSNSAEPLAVTRFTLAVNRQKKGEADFISCISFGKTAEAIANYVKKGQQIAIEGRIQTGSYQKDDGTKVYTTDVITDKFYFADGKQDGNSSVSSTPKASEVDWFVDSIEDEDMPF